MVDITIWSKPHCVLCEKAKLLLKQKNIPFRELTLDIDFTREELLAAFPEQKMFPVIILDGFNISYALFEKAIADTETETRTLLNEGEE